MGTIIMGGRAVTGAAFEDLVARAMSGFDALGIAEGDVVAVLMRNDIEFVVAVVAAERLGAYTVTLNWHAKPDEHRHILADSDAKVAVAHADLAPQLAQAPSGIKTIYVETPGEISEAYGIDPSACLVPDGTCAWHGWIAGQKPFAAPRRRRSGVLVYTSGTAGMPKGIQRQPFSTSAQEKLANDAQCLTFGIRPGTRSLISGPLYHSMQGANMRSVLGALGEEGVMVIEPRFDAERLLMLIARHRITQLMMVPVMFVRMLRLPESVRRKYDVSSVRWIIHAGAPCPVDVKLRMIEWFGPVINEFYGASETAALTLAGSEDYLRRPGTVGRAQKGCVLKIVDDEGRELPPGEAGEIIALNTAHPPFTYRNRPEEREKIDRGAFIAMGDVGYFDEEGYLFLCGRKKDMVISGGVNIFPAEIEAVLLALPGVKDCAVFGIPDEEYGEALAAHIELAAGADLGESAVREHVRARLAGYMVPRVVRFDSSLPREDNGKIYKGRIAEPYWREAGRRI